MEKDVFKIEKNEKLIAVLRGKPRTVINNYPVTDDNGDTIIPSQTIMTKPIVTDTVPRDGQALVYNEDKKQWEAGTVDSMRGNAVFVSATEPTNPEVNDIWIHI